jgi:hypothetical protein
MAHQIVLGHSSDSLEFIEVEDDISSVHSGTSGNSSLSLSESSNLGSGGSDGSIDTAYCQYKDVNSLIECLTCGSYFELDTCCRGC